MVTLRAAMDVVDEEGFDELLENVRDRIDEIESLHRTRELTVRSSLFSWLAGDSSYFSISVQGR